MNLKLNMKDINKILVKAHFKCNLFFNDANKQHFFAEKCRYEAVGSLPDMSSLLPHSLPVFCKCGEPCHHDITEILLKVVLNAITLFLF